MVMLTVRADDSGLWRQTAGRGSSNKPYSVLTVTVSIQ